MLTLNETFPTPEDLADAFEQESEPTFSCTLQNGLPVVNNHVYVPEVLRRRIIFYFHFSRVGAHQGIQHSYHRLSKYFCWPNMFNDVRQFAKQCLTCVRRRHTAIDFVRGNLLSTGMFEVVACDTVGPIWFREKQRYIFTCATISANSPLPFRSQRFEPSTCGRHSTAIGFRSSALPGTY
ncbi:hypothetical protein GNI_197800 [Gregarina niphandrodes]|uniref:Integrase zinc-binding domain-containing protein n=1 Tax=Gregarina niphandrodes TaxID=110365 RepID=A0A023AWQ2_GRENI|nr:hypothetical protein GNI_197800 [Gregarina niphandrodes]EZG43002.1 hypothetical protein GNI_197800 [Gregarina niphandrodes]|eukprot:XP_011133724.1 hypothetical protein GNI_197800 [Gregarina niphandrodes]